MDFYSYGIDHLNIGVSDADRAKIFYSKALAPLGIDQTLSIPPQHAEPNGDQAFSGGWMFAFASRSNPHKPFFWLLGDVPVGKGLHIAFAAATREQVDAFHSAALAAGGVDHGAPGIRRYHENYYGAFVRDFDGNNIEAVCHAPAPGADPRADST
jgi:catechol 2,3-dioxygenase-like lactoylglutathione lyase family enzyme